MNLIEGALGKLRGVNTTRVNLAENQVSVTFDESQIDIGNIKETIEEQGYEFFELLKLMR